MSDERKDLPPVGSPNFLEKVREALSVYLGNRGNELDRGITLRDLIDSGIATLRPGFLNGGRGPPIGGAGPAITDAYEPDLTPPPTPTGFFATAAISNIMVECAAQTYTMGHGHAKSVLYGASWISGPLPVFTDAVVLEEFSGTVFSHATNPATTWHLWLKWVTKDGVPSTDPAGGTNGYVVRTGEDVDLLVEAMTGPGNPFTILAVDTVIDGVTYPAGTYSTKAMIMDAQISSAKIKLLAVDEGHIVKLSATKLTAGSIAVGEYIQSTGYVAGSAGWRVNGDGNAEFSGVVVRGTVYASAGQIGGNTIDASGVQSPGYSAGVSGWRLKSDGHVEFGAADIRGQLTANQIDTTNLNIKDAGGTVIFGSGTLWASSYISPAAGWLNSNVTYAGLTDAKPPTDADHTASNVAASVYGQGAFATLSQITGGNVSTYIAGAAIGTAYIANGAITTALIDYAAVTTAKIADGHITNAKIGDLQVDTAKLAGNSVTVSNVGTGSGSAGTNITCPANQTMRVFAVGGSGSFYVNTGNNPGNSTTSLTLYGATVSSETGGVYGTYGGAEGFGYPAITLVNAATVTAGGSPVTVSASISGGGGCSVILFGMLK